MRATTIITGGGTGGHVYPALSIIQFLRRSQGPTGGEHDRVSSPWLQAEETGQQERSSAPTASGPGPTAPAPVELEPVYIGNARTMERVLVPRTGIPFFLFPMAPPRSVSGVLLLAAAFARTLGVMLRMRPVATIATGGYVSAPVALASWVARVPVILFLPDVVPGRAVAWLAPFARKIAVGTEDGAARLPAGRTVVTGYPVRDLFAAASREPARRRFHLPDGARVLLVFGGSQGSRSINQALAAHLPSLLRRYHVIHLSGEKLYAEASAAASGLAAEQRSTYLLFPYLHDLEMADALAASDLVLCRSGASTLGELPATGVPAILVPLPERSVHQLENAQYLARRGAAVIVPDDELRARLPQEVDRLLGDPGRLSEMAAAVRALARPDAARRIAELVAEVAA